MAGRFYPADRDDLAAMVDGFLARAESVAVSPKALVAPHAGYRYSGPVAGTAYATLRARRALIERVVLLGPSHRVPVKGFAVPDARAFATPLGEIPVDHAALSAVRRLPGVEARDDVHAPEHSLEVHLPFLQRALGDFTLVPVIVGAPPPGATARLLRTLWGGQETLVVVSSDLSHYCGYDEARRLDRAASTAMETLQPDGIADDQACGRHPIRGLLLCAAKLGLRATTLDLRNSGDTVGDRERVVGYGSYAFEDGLRARLNDGDRRRLIEVGWLAIREGLEGRAALDLNVDDFPPTLRAIRASFVTLKRDGELRGCIGSLKPHRPLVADVAANAHRAAFADRRFDPITAQEFSKLKLTVSILSHPRPIAARTEEEAVAALKPGLDGVILQARRQRRLFLPQVWKSVRDPRRFLERLKAKAGLPPDFWSDDLRLYRFRSESFDE